MWNVNASLNTRPLLFCLRPSRNARKYRGRDQNVSWSQCRRFEWPSLTVSLLIHKPSKVWGVSQLPFVWIPGSAGLSSDKRRVNPELEAECIIYVRVLSELSDMNPHSAVRRETTGAAGATWHFTSEPPRVQAEALTATTGEKPNKETPKRLDFL